MAPKEQRAFYKQNFDFHDTDKSGAIGKDEIIMLAVESGVYIEEKDFAELIAEYDTNGSKELDFDEFLNMMAEKGSKVKTLPSAPKPLDSSSGEPATTPLRPRDRRLKKLAAAATRSLAMLRPTERVEFYRQNFDFHDADKSGTISIREARMLLVECGVYLEEENVGPAIASVNVDLSGELSFDEFLRLVVGEQAGAARGSSSSSSRSGSGDTSESKQFKSDEWKRKLARTAAENLQM
jgi:Ca2+-binding EF-hand superfamily protein